MSEAAEREVLAFAAGEGTGEIAGQAGERADVLAHLARRRANALNVAATVPEFEDQARWIVRNIDILTGDIRAGLHEGTAFTSGLIGTGPEMKP